MERILLKLRRIRDCWSRTCMNKGFLMFPRWLNKPAKSVWREYLNFVLRT